MRSAWHFLLGKQASVGGESRNKLKWLSKYICVYSVWGEVRLVHAWNICSHNYQLLETGENLKDSQWQKNLQTLIIIRLLEFSREHRIQRLECLKKKLLFLIDKCQSEVLLHFLFLFFRCFCRVFYGRLHHRVLDISFDPSHDTCCRSSWKKYANFCPFIEDALKCFKSTRELVAVRYNRLSAGHIELQQVTSVLKSFFPKKRVKRWESRQTKDDNAEYVCEHSNEVVNT